MLLMTVYLLIALLIPSLLLIMFSTISTRQLTNREKSSPFECGFDPTSKARLPFSLRFFLLAVLFLVFDIEIVIILPLPILLGSSSFPHFTMASMLFITILTLGLFHEWNEGSLKWAP